MTANSPKRNIYNNQNVTENTQCIIIINYLLTQCLKGKKCYFCMTPIYCAWKIQGP